VSRAIRRTSALTVIGDSRLTRVREVGSHLANPRPRACSGTQKHAPRVDAGRGRVNPTSTRVRTALRTAKEKNAPRADAGRGRVNPTSTRVRPPSAKFSNEHRAGRTGSNAARTRASVLGSRRQRADRERRRYEQPLSRCACSRTRQKPPLPL